MLTKRGIRASLFKIYDGAGESRYNLIAPKAVVDLLELIYKSPDFLKIFTQSLPQYGNEGTLKYRKIKEQYSKYIYAKTGSLNGVSALAGFYLPKNRPQYAFAIMINNYGGNENEAKRLIDQTLEILLSSTQSSLSSKKAV